MAEYAEVARLDQLPVGTGTTVTVANKDVALFNVDGTVCAIDNACRHQAGSLGTSKLDGKVVTCRAHGWRYDVTTGSTLHVPGYGVATYPVEVVEGEDHVGRRLKAKARTCFEESVQALQPVEMPLEAACSSPGKRPWPSERRRQPLRLSHLSELPVSASPPAF